MDHLRARIRQLKHADEAAVIRELLAACRLGATDRKVISRKAGHIVTATRERRDERGTLDAFLGEFGLSNAEGITLMCLAESLLRTPDADTQDALIAERIKAGNWREHLGHSDKVCVNAGVWALMLTGRLVEVEDAARRDPGEWLGRLASRASEPVIRQAVNQAMRIMGGQFVFGRSIDEALERSARLPAREQLFSFDMLGEGARTEAAAKRYAESYRGAIEAVGAASQGRPTDPRQRSSISIKLSALHPRYEQAQEARAYRELGPRIRELAQAAKRHNIQLTIDAEEADRLDLSLGIFEALCRDPDLADWNGLGLALQAYQKRAPAVIDWLAALATETRREIPVRLVKGAYWDTEIKHAQVMGYPDFPVFTRKEATDASYLVCAQQLLAHAPPLQPQFATHNALSIAAVQQLGGRKSYEFQRLHGMGDLIYAAARETLLGEKVPLRTYAPVGAHRDLLPYLVRRLLENGANSSFVNRFLDAEVPVEEIVADPLAVLAADPAARGRGIALPAEIFGPGRRNARGVDLSEPAVLEPLLVDIAATADPQCIAACRIGGKETGSEPQPASSPTNRKQHIGAVRLARAEDREAALATAAAAWPAWNARGGAARAAILRAMGDALEGAMPELLYWIGAEAGRTLPDGVAEVREAVDFCRFYANEAERLFGEPTALPGPTGESNELTLAGRGVFLCISPWNFPLAIFTGQLAAALAAGNTVIAKPAEQTNLIAATALRLFFEAGLPPEVLQLLLGDGPNVAAPLLVKGSQDVQPPVAALVEPHAVHVCVGGPVVGVGVDKEPDPGRPWLHPFGGREVYNEMGHRTMLPESGNSFWSGSAGCLRVLVPLKPETNGRFPRLLTIRVLNPFRPSLVEIVTADTNPSQSTGHTRSNVWRSSTTEAGIRNFSAASIFALSIRAGSLVDPLR